MLVLGSAVAATASTLPVLFSDVAGGSAIASATMALAADFLGPRSEQSQCRHWCQHRDRVCLALVLGPALATQGGLQMVLGHCHLGLLVFSLCFVCLNHPQLASVLQLRVRGSSNLAVGGLAALRVAHHVPEYFCLHFADGCFCCGVIADTEVRLFVIITPGFTSVHCCSRSLVFTS